MAYAREEAGDRVGAEAVPQQAVDLGDTFALYSLARVREEAGDRQGAEDQARQVVDRGNADALYSLALTGSYKSGLIMWLSA
ncbi:hypothetical protein ACFY5F_45675 [Streptomyces sp. NPDC013161]|uniref:hypothetical protein n=1 Tax=Streptomyces sp. NPDC013161 TaxID=3364862 RepID=UPI00369BE0CE